MDAILQFLQEAFTMPTAVFSTLLGLVIVYWVIGLLGLGSLDGLFEGAADGVLDGAVDGVLDGAADGVLDGAADGVLDGAADAGLEGAAEGVEADAHHGGFFASGLGEMPMTIFLSLVIFFAWLFIFFGL